MKTKGRSLTIYAAEKELFPKKKKSHETSSVHLKTNFLVKSDSTVCTEMR